MASAYKIKIAARLRPPIQGEINDDGVRVQHNQDGTSSISVPNPRDVSQVFKFPFTSCYDPTSNQEDIFENDVRPMIDIVYSGITVTIFAYGVTSSGKTHTMQGTKTEPGIIPRAVEALFFKSTGLKRYHAQLAMSYIEIYKDEVYDLLMTNRESAPKLPVREDHAGNVFVANLTYEPLNSMEEFDRIYTRASKCRSVASTNLNRASSRSHAVLTVTVTITNPDDNKTLSGKLNLVDLAGSENNKLTGNDPSRMAESAAINKSLSVLGQVVHALNQGASRIPYRNSKLTRLLQDALGGSSMGLLICNLAPGVKFRQDTLNTLNFAVRTKNIENKPVVNERDNRPAPKPHFAALQQPTPKLSLAPTSLIPSSSTGSGSGFSSNSAYGSLGVRPGSRPSPTTSNPPSGSSSRPGSSSSVGTGSRMPRPNMGNSRLSMVYNQPLPQHRALAVALTDEEIDKRIARAVEAEVKRRLEEHQREEEARRAREEGEIQAMGVEVMRAAEEEARRIVEEAKLVAAQHRRVSGTSSLAGSQRSVSASESVYASEKESEWKPLEVSRSTRASSRAGTPEPPTESLPVGMLTPLLKKHNEEGADVELKKRLEELEMKFEQSSRDIQMVDVLSPVSKKRTGRAYVALARSQTEKGNYQLALELYRKAEMYVPENIKLKERIIEIEWAVKNGKPFNPSPKKKKQPKSKRGKIARMLSSKGTEQEEGDVEDGLEQVEDGEKEAGEGKGKKRYAPEDDDSDVVESQRRMPRRSTRKKGRSDGGLCTGDDVGAEVNDEEGQVDEWGAWEPSTSRKEGLTEKAKAQGLKRAKIQL